MLTRNDNVTVTFYHLGLKEAMTLVPLMNSLKDYIERYKAYEEYCNLTKEEQKKVEKVHYPHFGLHTNHESLVRIYEVLASLGFEAVP